MPPRLCLLCRRLPWLRRRLLRRSGEGRRRLDPARIRFWEVFANIRWAVIALQQSDRYLHGGARDLSTAIIGRRASECELELLMLLDPGGAPIEGPRASHPQCPRDGRRPDEIGDLPSGLDLAELGRRLLLDELLPLLPPERHRDLHLVATAIAIARREAMAGEAPTRDILGRLAEFYGGGRDARGPDDGLIRRFALDLRNGAFETYPSQERTARAILWRLTIARLREANPQFLAANGLGGAGSCDSAGSGE